jgi:hypothetical protein
MKEARALGLAQLIRDAHKQIASRAGNGEVISARELEQCGQKIDALIEHLTVREEAIEQSADLLAHRINNLLMAVQLAHDLFAMEESDMNGIDRVRKRLSDTIDMGNRALEEVREILMSLP